jgi:hypothetical protein
MSDERFPDLRELHVRHRGLTEAVSRAYAEAAHVCLSRHHQPPIAVDVSGATFTVDWDPPEERVRDAWANLIDAVEAGAYSMAIAAVEVTRGWFALSRAETLTGADYYVGPSGADLETAYRLEVSGVDSGDGAVLRARLSRKIRQTRAGRSSLPAVACVVGFQIGSILVSDLERPQ